jgi:hypothetical protein
MLDGVVLTPGATENLDQHLYLSARALPKIYEYARQADYGVYSELGYTVQVGPFGR